VTYELQQGVREGRKNFTDQDIREIRGNGRGKERDKRGRKEVLREEKKKNISTGHRIQRDRVVDNLFKKKRRRRMTIYPQKNESEKNWLL